MEELKKIQAELNAPKNLYNKFGGYKYRSTECILKAVKPLLAETNTTLVLSDSIINIGDRYYVKADATLSNKDKSVTTSGYAREQENKKGMDESQITGAASSYARKYALNGLFCIDDTKCADSFNNNEKPALTKKDKKSWDNAVKALREGKGIISIKNKCYITPENEQLLIKEAELTQE